MTNDEIIAEVHRRLEVRRQEGRRRRGQAWYIANREDHLERMREWYSENSEKVQDQYRAKREETASRPRPEICEACGGPPKIGKSLHYDHSHSLGHFRGWLCGACNLALGLLKDDPKRLKALLAYLKKYN